VAAHRARDFRPPFHQLDATTWPIVKAELAKALRLRAAITRAGWFN